MRHVFLSLCSFAARLHAGALRLLWRWTVVLAVFVGVEGATTNYADDWPMRGRDNSRNPVSREHDAPIDWDFADQRLKPAKVPKNIRWSAELGDALLGGDPVVAGGLIWIGTNNSRPRDKARSEDASVLMCFSERDGAFLYQYVSPRLSMRFDWPETALASSPLVEGDRLWFCTNRCEVVCLDISELQSAARQPQVIWKVDMREQLGVVPHGVMLGSSASHCSVASYKDLIYVNTTNATSEKGVPAPDAPSLVCVEKQTGRVRWKDNSPGRNILECQHGSPLVIEHEGRAQVVMGQGDGWVRAFDAETGEMLWKFDINRKSPERFYAIGSKRSDLVAMPVSYDGKVYFAVGRQFEFCVGPGRLCCIDPTKRGDISGELDDGSGRGVGNPNSGLIWEYLGQDDRVGPAMHRTLSSVAIDSGIVIAPDHPGIVHCLDAQSGKPLWTHDTGSQISTSPLIVGDKAYVATEDSVTIFEVSRQKKLIGVREPDCVIGASPIFANGTLYVTTRNALLAIGE
jgi:outer membrane protein assembly factor BamB